MTHNCDQHIESNMTPAHCSVCGRDMTQKTYESDDVGTREYMQRKIDRNFEWVERVVIDDREDLIDTLSVLRTNILALFEQARQQEAERVREEMLDKLNSKTRNLRIGQNETAREHLNLTASEIDGHNEYCSAWEDGYDARTEEVRTFLTTK